MKQARARQVKITILGSGTSTGVPLIGCRCAVCRSRNPKNKRLRSSIWIETAGKSIVVDTGPDFRTQALRAGIRRIDAVLYTHPHADHIHGIDDLRSYNFIQRESIPIFGNDWLCSDLKARFGYIFSPGPVEGGGIPSLVPHLIDPNQEIIDVVGVPVTPLPLSHGSKESLGYRINSVAYITDTSYIPDSSIERLKGLSVLVLDCARLKPHRTHFHLEKSLEFVAAVRPKKTYLTHLGHEFDQTHWSRKLPKGVSLAFDGLSFVTS